MECQGWLVGTDILFINIFISRLNNVNMGLVRDHSQAERERMRNKSLVTFRHCQVRCYSETSAGLGDIHSLFKAYTSCTNLLCKGSQEHLVLMKGERRKVK